MKSSVLYSPHESERQTFDIGILIPAYKEWSAPFVWLSKWLDAVTALEKRFRVLILILVNWPSRYVLLNQVTLELSKELKSMVQDGKDPTSSYEEAVGNLLDELQFCIYRNSERVRVILWESYSIRNTIGRARHEWCSYLKKCLLPSWIIISTDSDTWPAQRSYLQNVVTILERDPDIWWMTGAFKCVLESNASNRTHQLDTYEKVCSSLYMSLIAHFSTNDSWDPLGDLALMPGSNTVFRAWLYDDDICFSYSLWTWEDMDFSRALLEAGHKVVYDSSISVHTLYRPSDRTEYGLGTEISRVNIPWDFLVLHPQVKIWHLSVYQLFKHVSDISWIDEELRCTYLIQCLKDEFRDDIIDEETTEKLRIEIMSGKGLLVGRVNLNDKAIRIVNDRLSNYYWRLNIEEAYEWTIQFIQERLALMDNTRHGNLLNAIFLEELKKMRTFDRDIWNYEVFIRSMLKKIQVMLCSISPNDYQNKVIRLEPIPSP